MQRYFFSLRIAGLVVLAAIVVASFDLWLNGWNVVNDPDGRLTRAEIVYSDGDVGAMREFAPGYWGGRPSREAILRLVCANGVMREVGDAVPGARQTHQVTVGDCATTG